MVENGLASDYPVLNPSLTPDSWARSGNGMMSVSVLAEILRQ